MSRAGIENDDVLGSLYDALQKHVVALPLYLILQQLWVAVRSDGDRRCVRWEGYVVVEGP
jgi:hypothetical protein